MPSIARPALAALLALSPLAAPPAPSAAGGPDAAAALSPADRASLLQAREALWRAWFAGDLAHLEPVLPPETLAINAAMERWQGRAEVLEDARAFAAGGGRLVRLDFPRVEVQAYGDVAVIYSQYAFETDTRGKREASAGRVTEIFVRRGGRWVNPGWHMDSGR